MIGRREQAEAFQALGNGIASLMDEFDRAVSDGAVIERFNAIKGAEFIDGIAIECRKLAEQIEREAEAAEDALMEGR